jgi:hypothetical protein
MMNKRIRELVVESDNGLMRDGKLYPHIGIRFEEDWQRFAELIVRECIGRISIHSNNDEITNEWVYSQLAQDIKQHFEIGDEK